MLMPRMDDALAGVTRIGLDTMSLIYYVETRNTCLSCFLFPGVTVKAA